jgi:hypothetical protein
MPYKDPEVKKHKQREAQRRHYLKNPEKIKAQRRARYDPMRMRELRHGIKPPHSPGRCCDGCGTPFGSASDTHMDHDHNTGEFRGWLCMKCNRSLGYAGDNRDRLQLLINYLDRHELLR